MQGIDRAASTWQAMGAVMPLGVTLNADLGGGRSLFSRAAQGTWCKVIDASVSIRLDAMQKSRCRGFIC